MAIQLLKLIAAKAINGSFGVSPAPYLRSNTSPPRQQEHRDACANHDTKAEEYCRDTRVHDRAVLCDKVVVAWYKAVCFVLQDQRRTIGDRDLKVVRACFLVWDGKQ